MKIYSIILITLIFSACVSQSNVLLPIENDDLKIQSDNWINSTIPNQYHGQIDFEGSYYGVQYGLERKYPDDFKCTCYNYVLKTKQNQVLYFSGGTWTKRQIQVCFDSKGKVIETTNEAYILAAVKHLEKEFISLNKIKALTRNEIQGKSKFGEFPVLIYKVVEDEVQWRAIRYIGRQNVTLYEFIINALNGEVLDMQKLPYRRTFWQWFTGMKY